MSRIQMQIIFTIVIDSFYSAAEHLQNLCFNLELINVNKT